MNYHVLTLFPEMIEAAFFTSITKRAADKGLLTLNAVNIRDYAEEKRKGRVDDYSYCGGAGMIRRNRFTVRMRLSGICFRRKEKGIPE